MHFDGTVTLGNVISIAVFLATMAKLHIDNRERLVKIETKMDLMWVGFSAWMKAGRTHD